MVSFLFLIGTSADHTSAESIIRPVVSYSARTRFTTCIIPNPFNYNYESSPYCMNGLSWIGFLFIFCSLHLYITWLSNSLALDIPDESYLKNIPCALNLISTFYYYHYVDTSTAEPLVPESNTPCLFVFWYFVFVLLFYTV